MQRNPRLLRKRALLAVGLAAILVTAGCSGALEGVTGDSSGSASAQLGSVPGDAEMVGFVDADAMLADDSLRAIVNTALETQAEESEYYSGPTTWEEALAEFEDESGLDPSKLGDVTFFATGSERSLQDTGASGAVLTSSYTEQEVVAAMEDETDNWSQGSYGDTTLYTYGFEGQNALAVLGDGEFAIGSQAAVESVIDVRAGDEQRLDGRLKTVFQDTGDAYVRYAMAVPQSQVPTEQYDSATQYDLSAFNSVQYLSMSWTIDGDQVVTEANLVAESASEAERAYDVIDGALSVYSGIGDAEVRDTLNRTDVTRNGDTVTVSYENAVEDVEAMIEELYSGQTGSASSSTSTSATANATTAAESDG